MNGKCRIVSTGCQLCYGPEQLSFQQEKPYSVGISLDQKEEVDEGKFNLQRGGKTARQRRGNRITPSITLQIIVFLIGPKGRLYTVISHTSLEGVWKAGFWKTLKVTESTFPEKKYILYFPFSRIIQILRLKSYIEFLSG